jgi:hypothetical protein
MSDQDYVYAVFRDTDKAATVVADLHQAGLETSEICVLGNKSDQFRQVAGKIDDPTGKYFILFGIAGGMAGLIAGIAASLHIPGAYGFQVIIPLMATISGASVFPYFACLLGAFLTSNKPQHWASVFEGHVADGSIIIMAEPQSPDERKSVMDIFISYNPVEVIFRRQPWGLTAVTEQVTEPVTKQEAPERRLTAVA